MTLFTRLPLWRLHQPPGEAYRKAVCYWPFAGWVTGACLAGVLCLSLNVLSLQLSVVLAIASRLLLTGAFHEDGLADLADAMGGGRGRDDCLRIMKDTHTGSFAIIALILYFLALYLCLRSLTVSLGLASLRVAFPCHNPLLMTATAVLTADVWGKACASMLVLCLPYARKEQEAKTKTVYLRPSLPLHLLRIVLAMLPACLLWLGMGVAPHPAVLLAPVAVAALMALWLRLRLNGYTGDCLGACFLLCELSSYIAWTATTPQ